MGNVVDFRANSTPSLEAVEIAGPTTVEDRCAHLARLRRHTGGDSSLDPVVSRIYLAAVESFVDELQRCEWKGFQVPGELRPEQVAAIERGMDGALNDICLRAMSASRSLLTAIDEITIITTGGTIPD